MSKSDELTKDKIIKLQSEINNYLANALREIKRRASNTQEYCKTHHLKSKTSEDILEIAELALTKLDYKYAQLEALRTGVKKGQTKLDGD